MQKLVRILCPTDFSEGSLQALATAKEVAKRFGAELCLVYVLPIMPVLPSEPKVVFQTVEYETLLHEDAQQRLNNIVRELERERLSSRAFLGHGDAASELCAFPSSSNPTLSSSQRLVKRDGGVLHLAGLARKSFAWHPVQFLQSQELGRTLQPLESSKTIGRQHINGFARIR